jgi:protein SCO1/2
VYFSADETPEQRDYQLDHSAFIYVMDPQGKFVQLFGGATANDQIAAKLRQLMRQA